MRIVVDLQGAQGSNRHRGIGRYSLSLLMAIIKNAGDHEIIVALNDNFPESIEQLRISLAGLIPSENIAVWRAPIPVFAMDTRNDARRRAAELIRENALASLSPDYIIVTSLFEGLEDDIVTSVNSIGVKIPTAIILYDLIPHIHSEFYLRNPEVERWYERKLGTLRNADLLLAISESSRREAVTYLSALPEEVVNISAATDGNFEPGVVTPETRERLAHSYGLVRPFILYTGGIDHRKNIERLITAYARIPEAVRKNYHLAIICAISENERKRLTDMSKENGLSLGDVLFLGYVPEDDLLACYQACTLFVFPSWHEGFGLPVLEAMKCGRATIASNTSSLPEVIGLEGALFDPFDIDAIASKMFEVLTDSKFRERLERHGLIQSRKFTWDITASRALRALELDHRRRRSNIPHGRADAALYRPVLAFFSPLPPEASGISDYSVELLPELARHYRIYVITEQAHVTSAKIRASFPVRDVTWFRANAEKFDRIVYQFGNSPFHVHMFDLLKDYPGIVVLHDFFLSGVIEYRDAIGASQNGWPLALFEMRGWPALVRRLNMDNIIELGFAYPCNQAVLEDALSVIVHADYSKTLARQWYGEKAPEKWRIIPHFRRVLPITDRLESRLDLGFDADDFIVCTFGLLGKTKLNDRLLAAWLKSPLALNPRCHLVFVGGNNAGDYSADLVRAIRRGQSAGRIEITGWTDSETFRKWLVVANLGVQLRALSRGETSGAIYDCLSVGLATIVNANGAMAEIPEECVWQIPDQFTDDELVEALVEMWQNDRRRQEIANSALAVIAAHHKPRQCAAAYADMIETTYAGILSTRHGLERAIAAEATDLDVNDWLQISKAIAANLPSKFRTKRIFVDISELVQRDSKSGIQRVVRSIMAEWLQNPPVGWIVEPVYAIQDNIGYFCARRFTSSFLGIWSGWSEDEPVEPASGDIFIGLDLQSVILPQQEETLQAWRRSGVDVRVVVYDLLPMISPQFFSAAGEVYHHNWFNVISKFDGVICISRAVADEYVEWLTRFGPARTSPLKIDWFHLGADTESSMPSKGLPASATSTLDAIRQSPSFLSVGTIEPRKGQEQTLDAFETLWDKDLEINLVFVGKLGWMMDGFAERIQNHEQNGKRLFWLEAISDEYLDLVYSSSYCLIAASRGEGFGLPLIEAARHGLPILARDLPVFREIGAQSAAYFVDSDGPEVIADAVEAMAKPGVKLTRSENMKWLTWAQSASQLLAMILDGKPSYATWIPDGVLRLWGNDYRMNSQVGFAKGQNMKSDGTAGHLIYGPYLPMKKGMYTVKAWGDAGHITGTEYFDVASSRGDTLHLYTKPLFRDGQWHIIHDITLDTDVDDLEIRMWVDKLSVLSIEGIEVSPLLTVATPRS